METKKSTAPIFGRRNLVGYASPMAKEHCSAIHSIFQPSGRRRRQVSALQPKSTQSGSSTLCVYPETRIVETLRLDMMNWECYARSFGPFSKSLRELQLVQPTADTTALLSLATFSSIERIDIVDPFILSTNTSGFFPPANLHLRWKIKQFLSFGRRCATFLQRLIELPEALN